MIKLFGTLLVLLIAGLAGCSTLKCGDSHPYLNSVANPPLHTPPGLIVPAPDAKYAIQGVAPNQKKTATRGAAGDCLINPPQLINAQPTIAPKTTTPPVSGPVMPETGNAQSPTTPADKKATPPATSTSASPPVVAAAGRME